MSEQPKHIVDVVIDAGHLAAIWSDGSKTGGDDTNVGVAAARILTLRKMCLKVDRDNASLAAIIMYLDEVEVAQSANRSTPSLSTEPEKSAKTK